MTSTMTNKKEFLKAMPQGIIPLFFIQIVSTLSFSVLYSTLVLFMMGKLGLQASTANSIMGVLLLLTTDYICLVVFGVVACCLIELYSVQEWWLK